jgi:hypothetical protein
MELLLHDQHPLGEVEQVRQRLRLLGVDRVGSYWAQRPEVDPEVQQLGLIFTPNLV